MLHCFVLPCGHYVKLTFPRERKEKVPQPLNVMDLAVHILSLLRCSVDGGVL